MIRAERSRPALPTAEQFERWGIDPAWSRLVDTVDSGGETHTWHVLDTGPPPADRAAGDRLVPLATIICVHGNPTWSFYWRSFLRRFAGRYRVIAVDQLGMGFSDRTERRRFAQRVADLGDVIEALDVRGPVITAAHDWGGAISLGWVLRNLDRVSGVVLCNTGVAVPAGRRAPALIRLAASRPVTGVVCHRTRAFVNGTLALSRRRVNKVAREAYRAPYRHASDRAAIADFVADVPFAADDPSAAEIAAVADGIRALTMPVLLVWGAADPVFNDDFAADLAARMPHADRHRLAGIGHLVVEEADAAAVVDGWLTERLGERSEPAAATVSNVTRPIWAALADRRDDPTVAFVDGATGQSTSFAELHHRVMGIAGGLVAKGVSAGCLLYTSPSPRDS